MPRPGLNWPTRASADQFDGQGDHHTPKPYVRQAFCKYLECGIFGHGFDAQLGWGSQAEPEYVVDQRINW